MPLQHLLPTASLPAGGTLAFGALGLGLAFCWAKICRLTVLLQRREQHINRLLHCDRLTALDNRDRFFLEGERILRQQASTLSHAKVAVISLRVDGLKAIKNEFGYPVADELLQQIARRLRACMAEQNIAQRLSESTLARVGEHEFALLIAPLSVSESVSEDADIQATEQSLRQSVEQFVEQFTERLLAGMHEPFLLQSHTVYVDAKAGLAWATPGSSFAQLLLWANTAANTIESQSVWLDCLSRVGASSWADSSVKSAAEKPINRYAVFHTTMEAARISQQQLKQAIIKALDCQELRVRYQPIVALSTGKPEGFEALVRWQHPELGLLNPNTFLPLAEEMGLSVSIDRWVFQQVCHQLWQWQTQDLYPTVSVNLSGAHLSEPDVADYVQSLLERYPINPSQLTVEVTESTMVADQNRAISTLQRLQQMGLRVSLDDFGTGYCSLTYLSQFPVDMLKIDRSFICEVGADGSQTNEAIVDSVLSLADTLGIQVVAEGIECATQYHWLQQRKCMYGQGNFFAAAMTGQSAQLILNRQSVNVA